MNIISPPGSKLLTVAPGNAVGPCDLASPETTPATAAAVSAVTRRLPVGAELTPRGVSFRVWAPERRQVTVVLAEGLEALASFPLEPELDGCFSGTVESARAGTLYWYRLDDEADLLPDPASRFQPDGPMGASEVIDPDVFAWADVAGRASAGTIRCFMRCMSARSLGRGRGERRSSSFRPSPTSASPSSR